MASTDPGNQRKEGTFVAVERKTPSANSGLNWVQIGMTNLTDTRLSTLTSQPDAIADFRAQSRAAIDWSPLIVSNPAGSCQTCGLSAVSLHYKVPAIAGWFCSVLCVECSVFGPHRCRWCGTALDGKSDRRFCDESCARRSAAVRFGDGTRLLSYLARLFPSLCRKVLLTDERRCAHCGAPLAGKRSDSEFCDDRCRKRANRGPLRETPDRGIIADTGSTETTAYKRQGWGLDQNPAFVVSDADPGQNRGPSLEAGHRSRKR